MKMKYIVSLISVFAISTQVGCDAKKIAEAISPSITVLLGELTGTWDANCKTGTLGTGSNTSSYQDSFTFTSNGAALNYTRYYYTTANCGTGTSAGSYTMTSATVAMSGTNTVEFTTPTVRLNPTNATLVSWLNTSQCTGVTFTASTAADITGRACSFASQPTANAVTKNKVSASATTLTFAAFPGNRGPGWDDPTLIPSTLDYVFTKQ